MSKFKFQLARRSDFALVLCLLVVAAVITTLASRHRQAQKLALPVVQKLGGKVAALPAPFSFGGKEYYLTFDGCTLTRDDVDQLVVLNELTASGSYVTLSVDGATISDADRDHLRQILPQVRTGSTEEN